MSYKILIADDHPLFRDALSTIVRNTIEDCQIEEATDYKETAEMLEREHFNIVFLDLNMPDSNSLSDLALLKKKYPQIPMVVVSAHNEESIIRSCITHNASGYIIKSSSPNDIKKAIQQIMAGNTYVPKGYMLDHNEDEPDFTKKLEQLTPSQLKVFIEMGKGQLNKQIAYDLNISEATVKAHITAIFKKFGINNRTQAVVLTQENSTKIPELD